jgi:hypothetical protein
MHYYKLTPIKEYLGHHDWDRSSIKCPVTVIAPSEKKARNIASEDTDTFKETIDRGQVVATSPPWKNKKLVTCEKQQAAELFSEEGVAVVHREEIL